jgi:predicted RNase H-like nuclease (RuvC/YqgF family)
MELSISDIISIMGLLLGGGSIGGFFTWRYAQRKERAEAEISETTATKEVQDVYQQLIADVKTDRDEQKAYIQELKDDRRHLRAERDDLRDRIDKTEETVRNLQRDVARNGRMVESLRPFLCGFLGCQDRQPVTISVDGEAKPRRPRAPKQEKEGGDA